MKLLGSINDTHFIASIAPHDYVAIDGMMRDGGQPLNGGWFYSRGEGTFAWAEVPQSLPDLYNDYLYNNDREYGIWKIEDVKILTEEEYPDTVSFKWKKENALWGTRGKSGNEKLKYILLIDAETDHLENILLEPRIGNDTKEIVHSILEERKTK